MEGTCVHDDWPRMPEQAENGYRIYVTSGGRGISETARILGIPRPTVDSWATRYRWRERIASEDVSERDANIGAAYSRMARALPRAVDVLLAAMDGGSVARSQLSAAFGVLDRFGVSPIARGSLDVHARSIVASPVTDAELDRMLSVGDVASLLALASGRPVAQARALPLGPADVGDDSAGAGNVGNVGAVGSD